MLTSCRKISRVQIITQFWATYGKNSVFERMFCFFQPREPRTPLNVQGSHIASRVILGKELQAKAMLTPRLTLLRLSKFPSCLYG